LLCIYQFCLSDSMKVVNTELIVVIIEDEAPAADRLKKMLAATGRGIEVAAVLDSLAGARAWFETNAGLGAVSSPDLIFMDIELSDGLSLDLVRTARIGCPVIFVTAYDDYWQEAFEYNGIDYLLKPVKRERLEGRWRNSVSCGNSSGDVIRVCWIIRRSHARINSWSDAAQSLCPSRWRRLRSSMLRISWCVW